MKKTTTSTVRLLIAATMLMTGLTLRAAQLNGSLTFAGGVELDTGSVGTATKVTGWLDQNGSIPKVVSASGNFAGLANSLATFTAPWNFNSGPIPAFWTVGGFTFNVTSSSIAFQAGDFLNVVANGFISGNGFDPTPAVFRFSPQNPPAGGVFSFSAANPVVPCSGQIGDFVWNDLNGNGCQERSPSRG